MTSAVSTTVIIVATILAYSKWLYNMGYKLSTSGLAVTNMNC